MLLLKVCINKVMVNLYCLFMSNMVEFLYRCMDLWFVFECKYLHILLINLLIQNLKIKSEKGKLWEIMRRKAKGLNHEELTFMNGSRLPQGIIVLNYDLFKVHFLACFPFSQ